MAAIILSSMPHRWAENLNKMDVLTLTTCHLVKSEDLNHHGTLFAGRSAEWFVEAGFTAAASVCSPQHILCVKIHSMDFIRPVNNGEIIQYVSKLILAGRSSLITYISANIKGNKALEGFITFVHVDAQGKPQPHGLVIAAVTPEDAALQEQANRLRR